MCCAHMESLASCLGISIEATINLYDKAKNKSFKN